MPRVLRVIRRACISFAPMLPGLAVACAHATDPAHTNGVVQIAEVAANPTTIYCPNSTTIYINIRLVNTTRDTVTVIGVSSAGVVIRSTSAQLVGQSVYTFQSLSFTPAILRDRDGEATTTVILPVTCLSGVAANGYVDAYVALFVTTTAGQYATKQLNFRFNYPSGG